jgi:hypothetical protein
MGKRVRKTVPKPLFTPEQFDYINTRIRIVAQSQPQTPAQQQLPLTLKPSPDAHERYIGTRPLFEGARLKCDKIEENIRDAMRMMTFGCTIERTGAHTLTIAVRPAGRVATLIYITCTDLTIGVNFIRRDGTPVREVYSVTSKACANIAAICMFYILR